MRRVLCLMAALLAFTVSWAQRTVSGRVTDEKGDPLPNVSVVAKGTQVGTVSASDGSYTLNVPANVRALVFSSVGMRTQEVVLSSNNVLNATLQSTVEANLQEVVVVGYGTQRRRAVTSSIARVSGEDIANQPLPSFDKQLAGKAAGVNITLGSGLANSEPRIRIRGVNSLSLSRDPLIVIDGIPTFNAREGGLSGVTNTNPLSDINPADIESVEVLKDGAAAAIYGSRAANGVILITTKKGRAGRASVSYDGWFGSSRAFRKPDLLSAEEFVTVANEKFTNAGQAQQAFLNADRTNTNWLDEVFRESAAAQSHTLSINGGSQTTNFYASVNYLRQDGIIQTNFTESFRVRANLEHKPNRFLRIGNNITLSRTQDNDQNNGGNALSGAMAAALRALPNVRPLNPQHPTGYNLTAANDALGRDSNRRTIENNYVNIKYVLDKNRFNSDKYRIINTAFLEVIPFTALTIRSQGSIDYQTGNDFQYLDPIHGDGRGAAGIVFNQNLQRRRLVWQNYFNYNQLFAGKHNIGLTGGVEMQRDLNKSFFGQGTGIIDPFFAQNNLVSNTFVNQFSGGGQSRFGFQSFFGRLSYDFNNKYFVQVSLRRDGLSSLAEDKRYGTFPGVSVGWRLTDESFWRNSGINNVVSDFKLRGSYAVVGNSFTGFPYLTLYNAAPYGSVGGVAAGQIGNPELTWETSKKINAGADLSFFNNRFNLAVDYFRNDNDDLIFAAPTPVSVGIPGNSITRNVGSMRNSGWEFSLTGDAIKRGDFTWNVNFNFTTQKNEVLALRDTIKEQVIPGPNNGTFNVLRVGQPINAIFGYRFAGVNSGNGNPMWIKADGSLVQYNLVTGAAAGYYGVIKADDPALGPASTLTAADRTLIGSPIPRWFGGFTNSFNYKGFGLEFFLRFQGGNDVYNLTRQEVLLSQGFVNNGKDILNRWTPTNKNTDIPRLLYGTDNVTNLQGQADSRFVEDGDFLRLQNVTLSYNFDRGLLSRATNGYIKNARFFVQGQNLAMWTGYRGIDPENTSELGIDNASVPQLRTITLGLNVGF